MLGTLPEALEGLELVQHHDIRGWELVALLKPQFREEYTIISVSSALAEMRSLRIPH